MLEDEIVLMNVMSKMDNDGILLLIQAGLYNSMKSVLEQEYFWYLRVLFYSGRELKWEPREWRQSYCNTCVPYLGIDSFSHTDSVKTMIDIDKSTTVILYDLIFFIGDNSEALTLILDSSCISVTVDQEMIRESLVSTVQENRIDIFKIILSRYSEESKPVLSYIAIQATINGRVEILKILLSKEEVHPENWDVYVLRRTSRRGHIETMKMILEDGRINIRSNDYRIFEGAIDRGHIDMVRYLLTQDRIPKRASYPIAKAAERGRYDIVELLLSIKGSGPQLRKYASFRSACKGGHLKIAQLLFSRLEIDPSIDNNYCLRMASTNGKKDVVEWLLSMNEVDPMEGGDKPNSIENAVKRKREEILDLLVRDHRVESSYVAGKILSHYPWNELLVPFLRDRIQGCTFAASLCGISSHTNEYQVLASIDNNENSLLQYIIIKRPSHEELTSYLGEQNNPEIESAIRSVMMKNIPIHTSIQYTACRALLLVLLGWNHILVLSEIGREENVTREGVIYSAKIIGAHLGVSRFIVKIF